MEITRQSIPQEVMERVTGALIQIRITFNKREMNLRYFQRKYKPP
ncbi:hypothetical protein [Tissierella simiarum]|nr:hypothetical protein [Tissierella simiarum]